MGHVRDYVQQLRAAARGQPLPPIWIAALRRKMTRLAGEIAEGALGANIPLSHVAALRQEIPEAKRAQCTFANIAPIWINEDREEGLAFVRRFLALHMPLPNYTAFFTEAGYGEEVQRAQAALAAADHAAVEAAISERMAEDVGIFGSRSQIARQDRGVASGGRHAHGFDPLGPPSTSLPPSPASPLCSHSANPLACRVLG